MIIENDDSLSPIAGCNSPFWTGSYKPMVRMNFVPDMFSFMMQVIIIPDQWHWGVSGWTTEHQMFKTHSLLR